MDRVEADATPSEDWLQSLNATCNRLSTQYLNLLRAAASAAVEEGRPQHYDPRAGGGHMKSAQDPPPPPLAADTALSSVQTQLASENICVATCQLMTLIRVLKLSLLLMDEDTIEAEEELELMETKEATNKTLQEAAQLEQDLMELQQRKFHELS